MSKRILFLARKIGDAPTNSLNNSAIFCANYLNEIGVESHVVDIPDHTYIIEEVQKFKPTHIIIESIWIVPIEFFKLFNLFKGVHWYIRIHSDIGFFCTEMYGLEWFRSYQSLHNENNLIWMASNHKTFTDSLVSLFGEDVLYLPNLYPIEFTPSKKEPSDIIDIGCFGALRHMKNQGFQAICAIFLAETLNKKLRFHINLAQSELRKNSVIVSLRELFRGSVHELVEHSWVSHKDFLELVKTMDIGMQLSFTESFNIIVCDFLSQGVPILISDAITWGPDIYKASTFDTKSVVGGLEWLYKHRNDKKMQYDSYLYLREYLDDAKEVWKKIFL